MCRRFLLFLFIATNCIAGSNTITVKPIKPLPAKVVSGSSLTGLTYSVINNSDTASYNVSFANLNGDGVTYTSDCGNLTAGASCNLTLSFIVPTLSPSETQRYYSHPYLIKGAPVDSKQLLSTTIIESSPELDPTFDITLSDSANCSGELFTVTLTDQSSNPTIYDNVPCGKSTQTSTPLTGGTYTAHIAPATIAPGGITYDAPADFSYHLAKPGDTANFVYQKNADVAVSTDMTAPNIGSKTPVVACTGPASYSHAQGAGTQAYDNMKPGSYTCTAANYTGTDGETYTAAMANPYTIDDTHTTITVPYSALPPASTAVSTALTTPALPTGQTTSCTVTDGTHTYTHNQPTGTAHFDQIVDGSGYSFSCDNYTVGSDVYSMTPQTNITISGVAQTLTGTYKKNAPPGSNYDWTVDHLQVLKDANIFGVWWGGGSTTAPVHIGSNPPVNPFLNSSVATYEATPLAIGPHAAVKNFPSYIAMGTVSEYTTDSTDQMKAQLLDMDNHYEGNGDGNAGCAWDNSPGVHVQMSVGTGSVGTFTEGTYNTIADYYLYSTVAYTTTITAPNLPSTLTLFQKIKKLLGMKVTAAAGTLNIKMVNTHGDTYVQNVVPGSLVAFDNILPGEYTVTAASYVGSDSKTYNATVTNPVTVNGGATNLPLTYSIQGSTIAPSATTTPQKKETFYYDGTLTVTNPSGDNYLITVVYNRVPLHSNPNLTLVKQVSLPAGAVVTYNLTAPKLYYTATNTVGINLNIDGLCGSIWYTSGAYTPQINNIASQAADVKATNNHNLIAGSVLYTMRNSDSFDNMTDDATNPYSITFYLYNLMYEGYLMQKQHDDNSVDMVLLLNPDSTNAFQNCGQYYCPFIWESGLTQDTVNQLIQIPGLQEIANNAIDRMVAKGFFSAGEGTNLKNGIQSSGILVPPSGSSRTVPGVPELNLVQNYLLHQIAPNVPFGYGQNIYDNSNPLMAIGTPPVAGTPWATASVTWIHKVNHLGYTPTVVSQAIAFDAAKYAKYLRDMHFSSYAGDPFATYAPDFVYYDIYERDPIPSEVSSGRVMNGVDLDTYFEYIADIDALINNQPVAIWQIPGASMQVEGATFTGNLSGTWPDYVFGHAGLHNDMSNLAAALGFPGISFVGYLNTSVYYTSNSGVQNLEDYVKLTSASP